MQAMDRELLNVVRAVLTAPSANETRDLATAFWKKHGADCSVDTHVVCDATIVASAVWSKDRYFAREALKRAKTENRVDPLIEFIEREGKELRELLLNDRGAEQLRIELDVAKAENSRLHKDLLEAEERRQRDLAVEVAKQVSELAAPSIASTINDAILKCSAAIKREHDALMEENHQLHQRLEDTDGEIQRLRQQLEVAEESRRLGELQICETAREHRNSEDANVCCICFVSRVNRALPCGHVYCGVCVDSIQCRDSICPNCRAPFAGSLGLHF